MANSHACKQLSLLAGDLIYTILPILPILPPYFTPYGVFFLRPFGGKRQAERLLFLSPCFRYAPVPLIQAEIAGIDLSSSVIELEPILASHVGGFGGVAPAMQPLALIDLAHHHADGGLVGVA